MTATTPRLLSLVDDLVGAGLSIVPIRLDGSKAAAIAWKPFQLRLPNADDLIAWFDRKPPYGYAILGGRVSGNLELLDFDKRADDIFPAWRELVELACPGLMATLSVVRTPRDGFHVRYRCTAATIDGNRKLAVDPSDNTTLIETRGEGGYGLGPGCPAACHPSGKTYEHISGPPLTELSDITAEKRATLICCAQSFDLVVQETPTNGQHTEGSGLRPGDDFNARGPSFEQLLTPHGWVEARAAGPVKYMRRPGKASGWSATIGYCKGKDGRDLLAVFSQNAPPFEGAAAGRPCTCYSRFAVFTLLNHGGDYRAAAVALAAEGYGEQRPRRQYGTPSGTTGTAMANREGVTLGEVVLVPGPARQTPNGKLIVTLDVCRGDVTVTSLTVTSTPSSWTQPARILAMMARGSDRASAMQALAEIIGRARRAMTTAPAPTGPTVQEIVRDHVVRTLRIEVQTDKGLWSETYGEVYTRARFISYTTSALIDEASVGRDAPRATNGEVLRPDVIRMLKVELEVTWADLCATLPFAPEGHLGEDSKAAVKLRQAMIRLWTKPTTFEVNKAENADVASRASLITRVRTQAAPYLGTNPPVPGDREKWRPIHKAFAAWWRPHVYASGEIGVLLAMNYRLVSDIGGGLELPGITTQADLTRVGAKYGVLTTDEAVNRVADGGRVRLAVLEVSVIEELLDAPEDWNPAVSEKDAVEHAEDVQ
jgi:putative DNA primase/helicase